MIKCKCGKVATKNLQNIWVVYDIKHSKDGVEYIPNKTWDGSENGHYCEKCYEKEIS